MFRNSQQAIKYGWTAGIDERARLGRLGRRYADAAYALMGRINPKAADTVIFLAVQGQFCQEAANAEILYPKYMKIIGG